MTPVRRDDVPAHRLFFFPPGTFQPPATFTRQGHVTSDEQLMAEVGAGSREAFEELFARHRDAVWRFFARRLPNPGRVDELVQDVFLAILQNRRRYEPRAPFRAYLFGIRSRTFGVGSWRLGVRGMGVATAPARNGGRAWEPRR